ncbi:MAG TPA: polyketide synthase, partial [Nonomuraea sp.]|nr:polyketide synthase [Nonomuraea sp.]
DRLADPAYVRSGTVLNGIDLFDATLFEFTPREAEILDPQQRLFLETAWEALEDAGCDPGRHPGQIGVFAGSAMSSYLIENLLAAPDVLKAVGEYQVMLGNDKDSLPTRTSYKLDLRGPSISVNTACSTSLVALHLARQSLIAGDCDLALAGAVRVNAWTRRGYLYQSGGIGSPDGHCRPFDAEARGTIGASGVGIVVLKRLEDAIAAGDTIHAVVRGSAVNNDGTRKVGYTAPAVDGQAEVITAALASAGVDPGTIGYIEAHGTGTALGDPIEVAALAQVFTGNRLVRRRDQGPCLLGTPSAGKAATYSPMLCPAIIAGRTPRSISVRASAYSVTKSAGWVSQVWSRSPASPYRAWRRSRSRYGLRMVEQASTAARKALSDWYRPAPIPRRCVPWPGKTKATSRGCDSSPVMSSASGADRLSSATMMPRCRNWRRPCRRVAATSPRSVPGRARRWSRSRAAISASAGPLAADRMSRCGPAAAGTAGGSGASSRMTWALVPPIPKALTPALRGSGPWGHSAPAVGT